MRLTVAYDGTAYHGWQLQNNGITIESELNRCLTQLLGNPFRLSEPAARMRESMPWATSPCLTPLLGCLRRRYPMP